MVFGIIGGTVEWIFLKPGIISTTTSAADRLIDRSAEELTYSLWGDVARAYELDAAILPRWRVVKEKRATFAATLRSCADDPDRKRSGAT